MKVPKGYCKRVNAMAGSIFNERRIRNTSEQMKIKWKNHLIFQIGWHRGS